MQITVKKEYISFFQKNWSSFFYIIGCVQIYRFLKNIKKIIKILLKKKLAIKNEKNWEKIDWVLLTGATDGIGLEITKNLIKKKKGIILLGRNSEKLNKIKIYLKKQNHKKFRILNLDLSKINSIEILEKIWKKNFRDFPRIDLLLNNAGICIRKKLIDCSYKNFKDIINVNFLSPLLICNFYIKYFNMNKRKNSISEIDFIKNLKPNVIYISSFLSEYYFFKNFLSYSFSKKLTNNFMSIQKKKNSLFYENSIFSVISLGHVFTKINNPSSFDFEKIDLLKKLEPNFSFKEIGFFYISPENAASGIIESFGEEFSYGFYKHRLFKIAMDLLPDLFLRKLLESLV